MKLRIGIILSSLFVVAIGIAPAVSASTGQHTSVHKPAVVHVVQQSRPPTSLCTTFDQQLCGGDPGQFCPCLGDQVQTVNSPGRAMVFAPGPGGTGVLRFKNFGLCYAMTNPNSFNVKVGLCNDRGVSFSWVSSPNSHYFVNTLTGKYLTGFNTVGGIVAVCDRPCPAGGDQQWDGPNN